MYKVLLTSDNPFCSDIPVFEGCIEQCRELIFAQVQWLSAFSVEDYVFDVDNYYLVYTDGPDLNTLEILEIA